nr:hypothetical protein [uncultured Pseudomonas sp.]
MAIAQEPSVTNDWSEKGEILRVAEKLTKAMLKALQAEIMTEVETDLFRLAHRFGLRNLESLQFKAHRMDLHQGGVELGSKTQQRWLIEASLSPDF